MRPLWVVVVGWLAVGQLALGAPRQPRHKKHKTRPRARSAASAAASSSVGAAPSTAVPPAETTPAAPASTATTAPATPAEVDAHREATAKVEAPNAATPNAATPKVEAETAHPGAIANDVFSAGEPLRPWISLGLGYQVSDRWFRQTEPSTGEIRRYTATLRSGLALDIEGYPLTGTRGPLRDLGLTFGFARTFGFTSLPYPQGGTSAQADVAPGAGPKGLAPLQGSFERWGVGLRYRLPWGPDADHGGELGIAAGYQHWAFDFEGMVDADRELPRAVYQKARLGGDVRLRLGWLSWFGSLAYVHSFSIDSLGDRYPEGFGLGGEATLGASVKLTSWLSLEAMGRYTLDFYHLRHLPGRATDAAARVFDHTLDGYVGPRFTF